MTVVVGTAGHIDHGKTSLLRALTGIDADRLPEEQARGMTIDVGYAHLALDDGTEIDFVDVPGHDRLVGNMLVGAGEIDAALVVVAADDGPRAQTIEHLQLLDALAVDEGIAVITKIDAVDAGRLEAIVAEVRALLDATTLRSAPIISASSTTGGGLDEVRRQLVDLRDRVVRAGAATLATDATRLAIDRVFVIRGRGTVVTGTLRGGSIATGDLLRVVPGRADGRVRVREVQFHGQTRSSAGPGRVALNLAAGDATGTLERGAVLTTDAGVVATDRLLVALRPVPALAFGRAVERDRPGGARLPSDRARVTVHVGTAHVAAVVGRSGREAVDLPGGEVAAILRLDRPIAAAPGDRFALRRPSPGLPVGGGRVLDPLPPRGIARRRATPDRLGALAAAQAGTPVADAARLALHGVSLAPPALADDVAAAVDDAFHDAIAGRGEVRRAELITVGSARLRRLVGAPDGGSGGARRLVEERLRAVVAAGELEQDGDLLRRNGTAAAEPTAEQLDARDRLVALLSTAAPRPLDEAATAAGCFEDDVRALERDGRIVRLADHLAWAAPTYHALAARALAMARRASLTPAAYRDATGTSRKYVMAILEDLDRRGILRRTPDGHVPGPRAPQPVAADRSEP